MEVVVDAHPYREDIWPFTRWLRSSRSRRRDSEDAAQRAVADAGRTVEQIKSIWVKNFEAVVKDNKIVEYRVNAHLTFEVK